MLKQSPEAKFRKWSQTLSTPFQYQQTPRGYTFKCQHGPAECQGNTVHACAVKYVTQVKIQRFSTLEMSTKTKQIKLKYSYKQRIILSFTTHNKK